jgi:hypothetical protein
LVTIKLLVQDPNGYFIANIRRDNVVVYQNGIRQENATVEVEYAQVSLRLLMEFGDRTPALNRELGQEVLRAGEHLVDELSREDRLAVWKYNDRVEKVSDFWQNMRRSTPSSLSFLKPP